MRIVPAIEIAVGLAVNVWSPTVLTEGWGRMAGEVRRMLEVPIMRTPEGASEIGVPDIATPGPPSVIVAPARTMTEANGATAWVSPSTTDSASCGGRFCCGGRLILEEPTTSVPDGARETGVPPIVIAGTLGLRVDPATKTLSKFASAAFPVTGIGAAAPGAVSIIMPATGSSDIVYPPIAAGLPFANGSGRGVQDSDRLPNDRRDDCICWPRLG